MNNAQARIREELRLITQVLEAHLERRSRWSGQVFLVADADFQGRKPFGCDILLNSALASQDVRWRTLIHEALHGFSEGYIRTDYQAFRGWEEGVVEQLQRLLRPQVLSGIGVTLSEAIFSEPERTQAYNRYIAALERLRDELNISQPLEKFYTELLATPIKDRHAVLLRRGLALTGERRLRFIQVYSTANATLLR